MSSSSRVRRWLSSWIIDENRARWAVSTFSLSRRIYANDRIDVIGVRSSWLT